MPSWAGMDSTECPAGPGWLEEWSGLIIRMDGIPLGRGGMENSRIQKQQEKNGGIPFITKVLLGVNSGFS